MVYGSYSRLNSTKVGVLSNSNELKIPECILFEDNHLLAVCKPCGILVQGDKSGSENLLDTLKRLDRPCSGVVVFAKTSKAAARLSEAFRSRAVSKSYVCVVNGQLKGQADLNHSIMKSSLQRVRIIGNNTGTESSGKDNGRPDVVQAKMQYTSLCTIQLTGRRKQDDSSAVADQTLLHIDLETGRKHQIRAQLQHIGHPIVGDMKYGAPQSFRDRAVALHACSLALDHPVSKQRMRFSAPAPTTWEKRFGTNVVASVDQLIRSLS